VGVVVVVVTVVIRTTIMIMILVSLWDFHNRIIVLWNGMPCRLGGKYWVSTLKMRAAGPSKRSVPIYQVIWYHTTCDSNLHEDACLLSCQIWG